MRHFACQCPHVREGSGISAKTPSPLQSWAWFPAAADLVLPRASSVCVCLSATTTCVREGVLATVMCCSRLAAWSSHVRMCVSSATPTQQASLLCSQHWHKLLLFKFFNQTTSVHAQWAWRVSGIAEAAHTHTTSLDRTDRDA